MKNSTALISLFLVSVIWGATFPIVKASLDFITPMGFITLRFLLASLVLLLFYFKRVLRNKDAFKASFILGIFLFLGYTFQTIGLKYTSSSNAGFITGLYVVFTPLFARFIVKERLTWRVGVALVLSLLGLYFLSGISGFNFGDLLELLCAIAYGIHVSLIGKFSREKDSATLTIMQLFFVFLLSSIWWGGEGFPVEFTPFLAFGIILTGIFASAIGILLQVKAQRQISPSRAAIIFTTEPVFAGLFSFLFLGEMFTALGIFGAALILLGMLLVALDKSSREPWWQVPE